MPDNIETTIYRLQVDGSAYIDGVDKVSASTDKLSAAQLKANQRLTELKSQLNSNKKSLEEINAVIQANEKEVIDLTKQLNALRDSGKGSTAEMQKLKAQLRDLSVNTKEFKVEATELRTKIAQTTTEIKSQTVAVKSLDSANGGFTTNMTKVYGGLSRIAQLIPGIGIGGLVALISGPVINAFQEWFGAIDAGTAKQKLFNEVFNEAGKSAGAEITRLQAFRDKLNDLNIPANDRIRIAKEYNKVADETNKIDLKQIDNLTLINTQISKQNELIIQRAVSTAALSKLTGLASNLVEKDLKLREELRIAGISEQKALQGLNNERERAAKANDNITKSLDGIAKSGKILKPLVEETKKDQIFITKSLKDALNARNSAKFQLENETSLLSPLISVDGLTTKTKTPAAADTKKVENVYEQKLLELNARLASVTAQVFQDDGLIRKEFEAQLNKELGQIDKLFKDKKLKADEADELKGIIRQINDTQLTKELEAFAEKRKDAEKRIADALVGVRIEIATQRINNLKDDFERERLSIEDGYNNTITVIQKKEKELIDKINDDVKKGIITKADGKAATDLLRRYFGDLLTEAGVARTNRQLDLAMKVFQNTIKESQEVLATQLLNLSEEATGQIQLLTEKYLEGKVNFEKYQKGITKILKDEAKERKRLQLEELKSELERIDQLLVKTTDADQQLQLSRQQRNVRRQISGLQRDIATDDGKSNPEDEPQIQKIAKYAREIGVLTNTVISFWQQMNEAEQKSLDKSISLQEKRVDAARRIAERGNAEYLKLEEDRLTTLNIKKENAARKQLGINAALQASEILVALISGLASGAKVGGGLGAVISVTAIAAAIAGAFAIAESLKPTTPSFFIGTKDTGTGGKQDSKGGFVATLHPYEAVIPADRNKAYKPAVEAIFDKTIPAEHLNDFVKQYHVKKTDKQPGKQTPPQPVTQGEEKSQLINQFVISYPQPDSVNKEIIKDFHTESFVNKETINKEYFNKETFKNTVIVDKADPKIIKIPQVQRQDLISFVNNYHPIKMIPSVNYERIKETAELHVTHDGRMSVLLAEHSNLLKENNELQKQILKKQIKVENSIDRNGVATMVSEHIDLIKRSQKI